ncbi:low-density lipoprotein receptor-related protein 1-like [Heptranchias perlo]|uniref:low-density lipoprotein receptor-related protein 1-like n=1 Tax=Heptranchias perlo TaxID=212740 RepID=UPI003559CA25
MHCFGPALVLLLGFFVHGVQVLSQTHTTEAQKTCSPKQFVCKDQITCISKGWRCDGEKDCPDGSDETADVCPHQKAFKCAVNEYQCLGTEICIHMSKLCDGDWDCSDGYDEGPHCRAAIKSASEGQSHWELLPLAPVHAPPEGA